MKKTSYDLERIPSLEASRYDLERSPGTEFDNSVCQPTSTKVPVHRGIGMNSLHRVVLLQYALTYDDREMGFSVFWKAYKNS